MAEETDTRAALLAIVRDRPGECTRRLAEAMGREETGTDYHLRRLQRDGLVQSQPFGRDRRWFAADCGLCPVLRRAIPLLRRPEAAALAGALDGIPRSAADLAERSRVRLGQTRWLSVSLAGAFLAERTASGRIALRDGAQTCRDAAQSSARCEMWGRCEVSRAWRKALAGNARPAREADALGASETPLTSSR